MFYGNCFTEREDLYTKAVLHFLSQFGIQIETYLTECDIFLSFFSHKN